MIEKEISNINFLTEKLEETIAEFKDHYTEIKFSENNEEDITLKNAFLENLMLIEQQLKYMKKNIQNILEKEPDFNNYDKFKKEVLDFLKEIESVSEEEAKVKFKY